MNAKLTSMRLLALAALAVSPIAQASTRQSPMPPASMAIAGTWINPRGTVAVKAADCSGSLCGWISWASTVALSDAASAGVPRLIGTKLLEDYRPGGAGRWRGRVYVPDIGRSFQSTIDEIDSDHLKISGCILGGLFCRSQIWRRG
jgi:uncharacterized protein (DUF2147 family)